VRLAFLTHEPFYPPSGGGSAEAVYLVEELVRRGHEVHVFSPVIENASEVAARFRITHHAFSGWRMGRYTSFRSLKYLLYPAALARMVAASARNSPFDLILSQHTISAVAAGRLRSRLGTPVVMNFLDYLMGFMETWPAWLAPHPIVSALKRFELSLPLRYGAEGIMTVSDTLADYFVAAGCPRDRIRPIYYGYDSELFRPPAAAAPDGSPVVVMHGSFDFHHLGEIAASAVVAIHKANPDVVFKFVGRRTEPLIRFFKTINERATAIRLESTGFIPYSEVPRQLALATVGICPYEESTGTHCAFVAKIVECLGMGIPVVSTPLNNAKRYFAGEAAVRFSGFDGADFAQKVLGWLAESGAVRAAAGRAAAERVRRELDWRVISRNACDFLETLHAAQRGLKSHV
jgi:glycosyltransferase involved in cell wall biosynthesis